MKQPFVTEETLPQKTKEWMKSISRRNIHKWPFNINSAALLVIDMQRYFLEKRARPPRLAMPQGSRGGREHGFTCGGAAAISNVKKLVDFFRNSKRPVIFTRHAHKRDGSDLGILKEWWGEMPVDGTIEAEIDPRLAPLSDETIITKNRYSAFFNTCLDEILKSHNIKEVVITGVMTNICCESTARDAFFRDYMVRFIADATGSVKEEMHLGTLLNLAYAFADVCTTDGLMERAKRDLRQIDDE